MLLSEMMLKLLNRLGFYNEYQVRRLLGLREKELIDLIQKEASIENQRKISDYYLGLFGTGQKINLDELIKKLIK